jgi:hypothetical protein
LKLPVKSYGAREAFRVYALLWNSFYDIEITQVIRIKCMRYILNEGQNETLKNCQREYEKKWLRQIAA